MDLPLEDGSRWEVPPQFQQELAEVFPRVAIADEIAKMKAWLLCNPARRKTRRGIKRFVGNWILKAFESLPRQHNHLSLTRLPSCCDCPADGTEIFQGSRFCAKHAEDHRKLGR